jgi:integrase
MKAYRSCSCRAPESGRPFPTRKPKKKGDDDKRCPLLAKSSSHGAWFARFEAPPGADGKRRQLRVGPYATEREARDAVVEALGKVSDGKHVDDRKTTLGEYLDRWLEWKRDTLKPSTFASYAEGVELYFRPGLGHIRLVDLRADDVKALYAAMRKISRAEDGDRSELLRRLVAARARWHVPAGDPRAGQRVEERISTRPLADARIRRMHAVLRAALNDAETLPVNPAAAVKFGKARKVKPLLWTGARTERWQDTGEVPAKVMVWTPAQCGQFLDEIEARRLYALFHLAAYWGLRRGELAGLAWSDVDLRTRRVHIRGDVKSEDSDRELIIDQGTADVLGAWRKVQLAERLAWGPAWTDTGLCFTREDGTPVRPGWISERFGTLAARAGLPPVRFHDLRHGAASMQLAAGTPMKVVSEMLGHATYAFTADVYTSVSEELAESAATAIAAFVPRKNRMSQQ